MCVVARAWSAIPRAEEGTHTQGYPYVIQVWVGEGNGTISSRSPFPCSSELRENGEVPEVERLARKPSWDLFSAHDMGTDSCRLDHSHFGNRRC